MTVRTRFAPSPTGRLHLGNIRAAVFNWLFARRHGGAFVLRIEDTDVARNVAGAEAGILEDLGWLGLDWDEGPDRGGPHAPYRQSGREALYAAFADRLLASGHAYPCFCGDEALEAGASVGREGREVRRYPGTCRNLTPEERAGHLARGLTPVIRFAVPQDRDSIAIRDEVFGPISFPLSDIDDFVIRRSDGRVTYNFAVVVDDVDMAISHVIRGVGHLSNTPKQAVIFDALGAPRPVFAHLPTVLGADGHKLSKRDGAAAVADLRAGGFPADGVLNYLSLLGWSHPGGKEVLTRRELVDAADLGRVGRSDTQVDPEKLLWIAQQHLAAEPLESLAEHVRPFLDRDRFPAAADHWTDVVAALRSRLATYADINDHLPVLFPAADAAVDTPRAALAADPGAGEVLRAVLETLRDAHPWEDQALGKAVRAAGAQAGAKGAALFHPLRVALIGSETGPDLGKILAAIGRKEALARISAILGGSEV
ncbi:MAG TPA: glutamate--tRNA ligase [Longimicrobiales bacterium]|nr:glutamate--tRNA ligase [Longimicrobiales bacterium]